MPSLKDLRMRINSVKATQKITSAMKMVAAAKLRRTQELVEVSRPYAHQLHLLTQRCLSQKPDTLPLALKGREEITAHLILLVTSDRGLCGAFNANLAREAGHTIRHLEAQDIPVKVICIGRRGRDLLRREFGSRIIKTITDVGKQGLKVADAEHLAMLLINLLQEGEFGKATLIYSVFRSALTQVITKQALFPLEETSAKTTEVLYKYEPNEEAVLEYLANRNMIIQLFQALAETLASEHGARMTAMDNATRNARDVIKRLELHYNRTRQAYITRELIEIISGAEAL